MPQYKDDDAHGRENTVSHPLSQLRCLIREMLSAENMQLNYFLPGDTVLYGKWKNKRGRVISLYPHADTGEPMMKLQPIKGGSPIDMSLFKMRRAPRPEDVPRSTGDV